MTTGRINQVTILEARAGAHTRSHSQEFVALRGSFELIRSFKSTGHTARALDAPHLGPVPFTARLVLSLDASVHERSSSGSSDPPPSRLAVSAPSVDAFSRTLTRRATVDSHPIRVLYTIAQSEPIHAFLLSAQRQPRLVRTEFEHARLEPDRSKPLLAQKS